MVLKYRELGGIGSLYQLYLNYFIYSLEEQYCKNKIHELLTCIVAIQNLTKVHIIKHSYHDRTLLL